MTNTVTVPAAATQVAETRTGIFHITIWQLQVPSYCWKVQITDALGVTASFDWLTDEAEARQFANRCWHTIREYARPWDDFLLNPQEVIESVAYEFSNQEAERCCECEIDWKCPLCQELGRYHSRLDA